MNTTKNQDIYIYITTCNKFTNRLENNQSKRKKLIESKLRVVTISNDKIIA